MKCTRGCHLPVLTRTGPGEPRRACSTVIACRTASQGALSRTPGPGSTLMSPVIHLGVSVPGGVGVGSPPQRQGTPRDGLQATSLVRCVSAISSSSFPLASGRQSRPRSEEPAQPYCTGKHAFPGTPTQALGAPCGVGGVKPPP